MHNQAPHNLVVAQFALLSQTAQRYWPLLLAPILLLTAAAGGFTLVRSPIWKATQGLIVRDQISERSSRGEFESLDAMKTAQETIMEIARNRVLVERALSKVGPPADAKNASLWPTAEDVEDATDRIAVTAPKGAEFGSTEVIYIAVESNERERALRLTMEVCNQLDKRLQELRQEKADSIIAELEKSLALSEAELEQATRKLESMEREVGGDLGELRILNTQGSGESNLRSGSIQIKNELRQAESLLQEQEQLMGFLRSAIDDPKRILGAPSRLLDKQPALRRLKEGLVDAQLRTAELSGTRGPDHPLFKAARIAEQEVRRDLNKELNSSIRGLQAEIEVSKNQASLLRKQLDDVSSRMARLAGLRARYGNLVAAVKHRESIVADVRRSIADARSARKAALATSLLTRMDSPVIGNRPEGPSSIHIVGAGVAGGAAASFGLLLLLAPMGGPLGRRRNDQAQPGQEGRGRRSTDVTRGRRASDTPPARRATDQPEPVAAPEMVEAEAETDERRESERRLGDRRSGERRS